MPRLRQFLALAVLTAVDAVRQPICVLLTVACVLLTALTPLLLMHHFGEDGKLARDSGLACHFVFGLFIAGYAAAASLAREIRGGTVATVLSKPVGRATLFLAKFAGIAGVVVAFSLCASAATLLAERVSEKFYFTAALTGYYTDWVTGNLLAAAPFAALLLAGWINWRTRRPFASVAFGLALACVLGVLFAAGFYDRLGRFAPFDCRVAWRILPASLLVTLALIVLAAAASALATRLASVPTLTLCAALFLAGLLSDYVFGRRADTSAAAALLYAAIPNWQHFWVSDALIGGGTVPASYVAQAALYAAACAAGFLCLGAASFANVET